MNEYKKSLYALNKYSESIVYRFGNEIIEITIDDYLEQNPTHTEADFWKYKAISDNIFYCEDLADTRYRKGKKTINIMAKGETAYTQTPLDILVEAENERLIADDEKRISDAVSNLFEGKNLTEIQKRRFIMHFYQNKSFREIAKLEGVRHAPVYRSIQYALKKLKSFFDNEG